MKKPVRQIDDYSEVMRQETPSNNYLRAFIPKPKKISFEIQDHEEKIVLVLRQHPITQIKSVLMILFLFVFLPFLLKVAGLTAVLPDKFRVAGNIFLVFLAIGMAFRSFLMWFFNVYIITDERIIDVDFISMIYKNISTAKIDNIEDITKKSSGIIANLFDYGTILIQTAATKNEFEFDHVPHPAKVVKLLNELVIEEEREKIEGRVN